MGSACFTIATLLLTHEDCVSGMATAAPNCGIEGCKTLAAPRGRCIKHGARGGCKFDGCTAIASRGFDQSLRHAQRRKEEEEAVLSGGLHHHICTHVFM